MSGQLASHGTEDFLTLIPRAADHSSGRGQGPSTPQVLGGGPALSTGHRRGGECQEACPLRPPSFVLLPILVLLSEVSWDHLLGASKATSGSSGLGVGRAGGLGQGASPEGVPGHSWVSGSL